MARLSGEAAALGNVDLHQLAIVHRQLDDAVAKALERLGHYAQVFRQFRVKEFQSIGTHGDVSGSAENAARKEPYCQLI